MAITQLKLPIWFIKLTRYEFWSAYFFYSPFVLYWLYLGWKAKDFGFFTKLNPSIPLGGCVGSDKIALLSRIHPHFLPKTVFKKRGFDIEELKVEIKEKGIEYPFFIKPNNGERGKSVEKIENEAALALYLAKSKDDIIIQEDIPGTNEIGVFVHRNPMSNEVVISSVTVKGFLCVLGNGKSTLLQLMEKNLRARMQLASLKLKFSERLNEVVPEYDTILLEPVGNHCRGTEFKNGAHLINNDLRTVFQKICTSMYDFDYGRFDLKFDTLEKLYKGEGIRILEVNGLGAEPSHIYDKNYSLFKAYRDVKTHLDIIYFIYQHKYKHTPSCITFSQFTNQIKSHIRLTSN